jgi:hypothetical protein
MTDSTFEKSLLDGSQMVSVLLVFVSVLFGIKYQSIIAALQQEIPDAIRVDERAAFRRRQRQCIFADVLPVGVPAVVLALILLPPTLRILTSNMLVRPSDDFVPTVFVLVEAFVVAGAAWSIAWIVLLLMRISQTRGDH